jgi:ferritin-like metal-binding protein YciE
VKSRGKSCEALRGLVEDAQDLVDKGFAPELLDVALIAAAQKMEHFEIAAYGSVRAHAEAIGLDKAVKLLDETLEEEKAMDERLNKIALGEVNERALEAEEEEGEDKSTRSVRSERAAAGNKPSSRTKRD